MKYFFYLLLLTLVFSLGMYIGIDRSEGREAVSYPQEEVINEPVEEEEVEVVDRDTIIEEVERDVQVNEKAEPTFLHSAAGEGEKIVKVIFDQIVDVTYTVVDGIF
ncbi:hypothetical protein [Gracilibacillus saliphilus]|uniref:hypothetical protein n=1 Tax=Gracilibacillus saliphilus TaxID=543890 RepID=UPI0013D22CA2|nr:hypothetical protein [Gracilibacillus saliphilus]